MNVERGIDFMPGAIARTGRVFAAAMIASLTITPATAAPKAVRYACPTSEDLAVQRDHSTARVKFAGRTYELQRQRSSIGDKYISSKAALIIDGRSATFVADDLLDLGTCLKTVPLAAAR